MNASLIAAFTPTGKLRASINLGNPVLAKRDPQSQRAVGVSVDMAHELGRRLGVEVELVVFEAAAKSVEAVNNGQADIGFFAIDPLRGAGVHFTAPYVLIEGGYMVRQESPVQTVDDVDRAGVRVAVGKGSAYDLFLSRELKSAEVVRAPTPSAVVPMFIEQSLEVAAGVKQALEAEMQHFPGLRQIPGRFMVIQQAMVVPRDRGDEAAAYLRAFVEVLKAGGFVADALTRHGIQGCKVADLTAVQHSQPNANALGIDSYIP